MFFEFIHPHIKDLLISFTVSKQKNMISNFCHVYKGVHLVQQISILGAGVVGKKSSINHDPRLLYFVMHFSSISKYLYLRLSMLFFFWYICLSMLIPFFLSTHMQYRLQTCAYSKKYFKICIEYWSTKIFGIVLDIFDIVLVFGMMLIMCLVVFCNFKINQR